jgi:hypothetical protein
MPASRERAALLQKAIERPAKRRRVAGPDGGADAVAERELAREMLLDGVGLAECLMAREVCNAKAAGAELNPSGAWAGRPRRPLALSSSLLLIGGPFC